MIHNGMTISQTGGQRDYRRSGGNGGDGLWQEHGGALVASQFATLESPQGEHGVLTLDATLPAAELGRLAALWWQSQGTG